MSYHRVLEVCPESGMQLVVKAVDVAQRRIRW